MNRLRLNSLSLKLSLVFSFFVAVISTLLIMSSYYAEKEILWKESSARYGSIGTNLAYNAEYGVLTKSISALRQMAEGLMREKDVNFIEILHADGVPLASAGQRREPAFLLRKDVMTRRSGSNADIEALFGGDVIGEAADPGGHFEKVGEVVVEFDTSHVQRKLDDMRRRAVAVAVLSTFGGVLFTYFIVHFMTAPLQDLARATARVASGELDFHVRSQSQDEIGALAVSFNTMTMNLKRSMVSRDHLDSILDSIPDAVIVVGAEGTIRLVNNGALTLSGLAEEDILGAALGRLLLLSSNQLVTKEGEERIPVSISEGSLAGDVGAPRGTVYVARDLRPIQKLQERLLQTEKMAAVGQLAAGVSHEINNPLGVILGFAQGLVRRLETGSPMEIPLKSIEREAMRCKDLVQDLLTFSRATHADRQPMDLNQAVEGALSLVQAQARMDRSEVKKILAPDLPKFLGNKNQIQQVVINLAKNALDAMPQGGIVTVKTEMVPDRFQSWVCLRVADQGTGIPPEVMPRIFEPFFTTKPVGKGTGLGLSLVYEIIKKHSGSVDVQSRPGWTEFCVKLPVRTGREEGLRPMSPVEKGIA